LDSSRDLATVIKNAAPVVSDGEVKDVDVGVEGVTPGEEMAGFDERVGDDYYPLEVGRYWVYRRQDPVSGAVTEVERRIVRRESRADRDLYFFDDGTVAYS
jgi:hypothetical protein